MRVRVRLRVRVRVRVSPNQLRVELPYPLLARAHAALQHCIQAARAEGAHLLGIIPTAFELRQRLSQLRRAAHLVRARARARVGFRAGLGLAAALRRTPGEG